MSESDCAAGDRSSLSGLMLASHAPLDDAQRAGRMKCSRCGASRMFYCYSCCALVGLEPRDVPSVKLPVKIDIIKHPNETDGKSTAIQARILAPQDVTIYTYPCIPELDQSAENIVLVFPGPDAMTVEELWEYFSAGGAQRSKRLKAAASETHTCPIQRVVFIDSTWNQTTRIITDERLQGPPSGPDLTGTPPGVGDLRSGGPILIVSGAGLHMDPEALLDQQIHTRHGHPPLLLEDLLRDSHLHVSIPHT